MRSMVGPNIGTGHSVSPLGEVVCSYLPPPFFLKEGKLAVRKRKCQAKMPVRYISFVYAKQCDKMEWKPPEVKSIFVLVSSQSESQPHDKSG